MWRGSCERRLLCVLWLFRHVAGFNFGPPAVRKGMLRWASTAPRMEPIPETSSVKVTVPVAGTLTKSAFKRAAAEVAASRPIPGWRQKDAGKIPAGVVASAVGPDVIKAKAIEALSESEVHGAISALGIEAVGQARFVATRDELVAAYAPGEPLELVVAIDVWPKAEWSEPYEGMEIEVERVEADDDVRHKAMEALRERYIDLNDVERPAEMGDMVVVNMEGFARGEDGEKAGPLQTAVAVGGADLEIILDTGKFLPGLTEALIGVTPGETRLVPIDFPDQARFREKQPLAGAKALFEVNVKAVKARTKPELNDAFASKIRPGLTLAQLEKEVEYTVGSAEDDQTKEKVHKAIEDALVARCDVPLPETVVVESARQKFAVMLADMRSGGTDDADIKRMISPEGFSKYLKVIRPTVERDLRARLVVEAIARQENLQVDPAEIQEQLDLVKRQYLQQEDQDKSGASFNEERAREKIVSELLKVKVLEKIAAVANVTYVKLASD